MNLNSIGWSDHFSRQLFKYPGCTPARVSVAQRGSFILWTEAGEVEATAAGSMYVGEGLWPATGDWVVLRDGNVIEAVLDRKTSLERKRPGKTSREQVLAANLDVLFIVTGLDHDYNPRRLERYLVVTKDCGIRPVLVLNKTDLHPDAASIVREAGTLAGGTPVVAMSASSNEGIEQLNQFVSPSETAALAGSSGVGKSTIVNCLVGDQLQSINEVREHDSRGRHTTTSRQLFVLPQGWLLMDMPGIRELQFAREVDTLEQVFDDISEAASQCRYRNCTHQSEPGCAVLEKIAPERLEAFRKLERENEHTRRQTDQAAALVEKQRWKTIHKAMRKHPKLDR